MRVCVVINAESRTNPLISKVIEVLEDHDIDCFLITRSRHCDDKKVRKSEFLFNKKKFKNIEICINSDVGRGLINIFQLAKFQFKLFSLLFANRTKYDVIHSFDLDTGIPVMIISKLLRKKYIYHIADFYVDSRNGIPKKLRNTIKKLEYKVIKLAESTIICTEERKKQIEGSQPKNLLVVHNTPNKSNEYRNFKYNLNNRITFTYIGGLMRRRFIDQIMKAFKKFPNLELELAGMGELEDTVKEVSSNCSNIKYHGIVDYDVALDLYSNTDIMFAIYDPSIPNHKYSAPNKVYEAMFFGKPIIVARGTGVDELVEKEDIGLVIDYNIDSLMELLVKISNGEIDLTRYAKKSYNAYDNYSWEKMKPRLEKAYNYIE